MTTTLPELGSAPGIAPQLTAAPRRRPKESAEDYPHIVAVLGANRRVIACAAGIQWIVQRRSGSLATPWAGRSFCRTKEALLRCAGGSHPALDALPDRFPEAPPLAPEVNDDGSMR